MGLEKLISLLVLIVIDVAGATATTTIDYRGALSKSLVFFETQRSDKLSHIPN
jgi:hypothetical protein